MRSRTAPPMPPMVEIIPFPSAATQTPVTPKPTVDPAKIAEFAARMRAGIKRLGRNVDADE